MTSADLSAPVGRQIRWRRVLRIAVVTAAVVALYVHAWRNTEFAPTELVSGFHNMVRIIGEMVPPDWSILGSSIRAASVTFDTALLGTTIAFGVSLLLAPLAARNLTPHRVVYEVSRALMGIARTIPLWVSGLLFLVAVGISPFAGVLALALETVGVLSKLYAEAIEEM